MNIDLNGLLADQLDWHWRVHVRPRLDGLTDDEYFWEPVPGCWSVRPRGVDPADGYAPDFRQPEPSPPPFTTIAWQLAHLIVDVFAARSASHFGGPPADPDTFRYAGTAAEALAQLDTAYADWLAGVRALGCAGLGRPCGPAEGPFAAEPLAALVMHINREAIHHSAAALQLRDLYRQRADLGTDRTGQDADRADQDADRADQDATTAHPGLGYQVVIDTADPHAQADWWAQTLGWRVEPSDEEFIRRMIREGHASEADTSTHHGVLVWREGAAIRHPDAPPTGRDNKPGRRILFQLVPEGKTVKNRLHLDLRVGADRVDAAVEALVRRGATFLHRGSEGPASSWVTMADPEGNEFCVT